MVEGLIYMFYVYLYVLIYIEFICSPLVSGVSSRSSSIVLHSKDLHGMLTDLSN